MTDSDLCPTPLWSRLENLFTCTHDVCVCVTSVICILLLIRSCRKVITLLASQMMPKNRQKCGHVFMDTRGQEPSPPAERDTAGGCSKFIHPFYTQTCTSRTCKNQQTTPTVLTSRQAVDRLIHTLHDSHSKIIRL